MSRAFARREYLSLLLASAGVLSVPRRARAVTPAVRELTSFGPAPGDGGDVTATAEAAWAWAMGQGGSAMIRWPAGNFRLSRPLPLAAPWFELQGVAGLTNIIPAFEGCPFPVGGDGGQLVESAGVRAMNFVAGVEQRSGAAFQSWMLISQSAPAPPVPW